MDTKELIIIDKYESLNKLTSSYQTIHGYVTLIVCIFGIPCNLLNILVLTRPIMLKSKTNLILTSLAISDLITMLSNLLNCIHFYVLNNPNDSDSIERDSHNWIVYQLVHVIISVTSHNISIWLTVYLAFFRFTFLSASLPKKQRKCKCLVMKSCPTNRKVLFNIIKIILSCILFCVPSYLYPAIREKEYNNNTQITNTTHKMYHIGNSDLDMLSNGFIYQLTFFSQVSI
jgi:hypothetical protein